MEGQHKPVRGGKQGMEGKRGTLRGGGEVGVGEAGVQRSMRGGTGKCWPARPPEREVRP